MDVPEIAADWARHLRDAAALEGFRVGLGGRYAACH